MGEKIENDLMLKIKKKLKYVAAYYKNPYPIIYKVNYQLKDAGKLPNIIHNVLNMDVYLIISPEIYLKRALVGGFTKVLEFGRCFQNEGIDTSHLQNFTILEGY